RRWRDTVGEPGVQAHRLVEMLLRLVLLPLGGEGERQVVVYLGVARADAERFAIVSLRLRGVAATEEHVADVRVRSRVVRLQSYRLAILGDRVVVAPAVGELRPEVVVRVGI